MKPFIETINESQLESIQHIRGFINGAHHVDLVIRHDGQDKRFEADWLSDALDRLGLPDVKRGW